MVSEPAPYPKRFASVCPVHAIIVESHIVVTEDTVTSDGQIACLCLSEPRFRDVPCRDSSEWTTRPHPDGACWLIDPPPSLRAFPAHSTCHHKVRKGLRPQAHVDGRNEGDALTPCVANASKHPHTQICCFVRRAIKRKGNSARRWRNGRPGLCKKHHFSLIKAHAPQKISRLRRAVAAFGGGCFCYLVQRVDRAGAPVRLSGAVR